jgi:hypothetical protein
MIKWNIFNDLSKKLKNGKWLNIQMGDSSSPIEIPYLHSFDILMKINKSLFCDCQVIGFVNFLKVFWRKFLTLNI